MKGIAGGMWLGALLAMAAGAIPIVIVFSIIGCIAAAAGLYDEKLQEYKDASWRAEYPSYKY